MIATGIVFGAIHFGGSPAAYLVPLGLFLFRRNLDNPDQVRSLCAAFRDRSRSMRAKAQDPSRWWPTVRVAGQVF